MHKGTIIIDPVNGVCHVLVERDDLRYDNRSLEASNDQFIGCARPETH